MNPQPEPTEAAMQQALNDQTLGHSHTTTDNTNTHRDMAANNPVGIMVPYKYQKRHETIVISTGSLRPTGLEKTKTKKQTDIPGMSHMPPTCTEAWSIRQATTHMYKDRCDTSGTCVHSLLVKLKTIVGLHRF